MPKEPVNESLAPSPCAQAGRPAPAACATLFMPTPGGRRHTMSAPLSATAGPFEMAQGSIIDDALEAIITVDDQQRIVMINPAAQRMFGCTASEALGSDLSRFIPPRYRATHAAGIRKFDISGAVELPRSKRQCIVGLRANGEEFPAEASISRLDVAGENGTRRYFTALLRDLSEEQSLKAEVEALKVRMLSVFELAPVAIWITEADQIVFANHACATLFAATDRKALVGRSIYSLLKPESHGAVRNKVEHALLTGTAVTTLNERIARLDGTVREVVIAVAGLPDHGRSAVQMVITDITERTRESEELERSRRDLRRLSANLVDVREEERRRIARELHDELGQWLTALKMELSTLASAAQRGNLDERVANMVSMVDETVASVRRIASDLRPAMLDELGLNAAVEWLARESARRMGIEITVRLDDTDPPVGDAVTISLYRMVQEALTNIARHARATQVHIEVGCSSGEAVLTVQDNGTGFSERSMYREGSHGLMGIRERAFMFGGRLEIGNLPGGGGRLCVRLPLRHDVSAGVPARREADRPSGGNTSTEAALEP